VDPIHPILASSPNIPTVPAALAVDPVGRHRRYPDDGERERRRRAQLEHEVEYVEDDDADPGGPHIDLTA
jgi:hypothetical protein